MCGFTIEHNVLCYYMYLYPSVDSIIEASMLISHHSVRLLVSTSPNQPTNSVFLSQQISTTQPKPAQKPTSEQAEDVVVVEPCLVAVLVRHVHVSGSLALRGGTVHQLHVCKAHVANSRSECVVCSVTSRILSTRGPWGKETRKKMPMLSFWAAWLVLCLSSH